VDELYSYMKHNEHVTKSIIFENEPIDASWGERFFHIREPDGYQLSFAQPLYQKRIQQLLEVIVCYFRGDCFA
jgi:hypothetical protein